MRLICGFSNAAAPSGCAGGDSRTGTWPRAQASLSPCARCTIEYLAPAMMDDLLTVETSVAKARGASIDFQQRILRDDKELVTAMARAAAIRDGRPARIPDDLRRLLDAPA